MSKNQHPGHQEQVSSSPEARRMDQLAKAQQLMNNALIAMGQLATAPTPVDETSMQPKQSSAPIETGFQSDYQTAA